MVFCNGSLWTRALHNFRGETELIVACLFQSPVLWVTPHKQHYIKKKRKKEKEERSSFQKSPYKTPGRRELCYLYCPGLVFGKVLSALKLTVVSDFASPWKQKSQQWFCSIYSWAAIREQGPHELAWQSCEPRDVQYDYSSDVLPDMVAFNYVVLCPNHQTLPSYNNMV